MKVMTTGNPKIKKHIMLVNKLIIVNFLNIVQIEELSLEDMLCVLGLALALKECP